MVSSSSSSPKPCPKLAEFNFVVEPSTPGAFEFPYVSRVPSNEPLHLAPFSVPVHDLRQQSRQPSIDVEGFTWLSSPYEDLDGPEGTWEDAYAKSVCSWLRDYLGAKDCRPINHQIRRRHPNAAASVNYSKKNEKSESLPHQPVSAVHVDINRERAARRVLDRYLDVEEYTEESNRLAIFNVWRPLNGPVVDAPLAMLDASSLDTSDMKRTTDSFGGGYFLSHNDQMRWLYISNQTPDEIFLFRQFDSTIPYSQAGCVAHSAFIDTERQGPSVQPRASIEVRCAVVF